MCAWKGPSSGRQPRTRMGSSPCLASRTDCLAGAPCVRSITKVYPDEFGSPWSKWYSTLKLINVPSGPVCGKATPVERRMGSWTEAEDCGVADGAADDGTGSSDEGGLGGGGGGGAGLITWGAVEAACGAGSTAESLVHPVSQGRGNTNAIMCRSRRITLPHRVTGALLSVMVRNDRRDVQRSNIELRRWWLLGIRILHLDGGGPSIRSTEIMLPCQHQMSTCSRGFRRSPLWPSLAGARVA
jgi:hypothetical protein